jgi:hypothetical protein
MERSEIRGGIDASRQSRITLRSIGATCLKDRVKIASLRIFAAVIDFRLRPHRASKPFCSNVSRQQSRCFNDLQCLTAPASATAFDNRRRIGLKRKIRSPRDAYRRQAVRWSGCGARGRICSPLPGGLGIMSPGIMTGVGGASLDWDRRRRVTPVQTASQEAWPEVEPLG